MTKDKPFEGSEHKASAYRSTEGPEATVIIHKIELPDWYATQFGRAVEIYMRGSNVPVAVLRPPESWGAIWGWNLCTEGVYFRRG